MRKTLLSLAALALSLSMNAQAVRPFSGQVEKSNVATQQRVITLSPKKADLASNQRLVGYYTTDELAEDGIGIPNYGKNENCKAAIDLTPEMLQAYDGMKVVAIRFGLCYKMNKSRVFISPVNNKVIGADVVSKDVASPVKGWNTITLDEPYTISQNQEIFVGFDFIQNSKRSGNGYTEDCYPLSVVEAGRTDMPMMMFANIPRSQGGSGEGWYSFGTDNGNLSIQLIVEGDFADYDVTPSDFGALQNALDIETKVAIDFYNNSKEAVKDLDYIVTSDGVAGAEQHVNLSTDVATGANGSFTVTVPGFSEVGKHSVSVEITKVNGNANQSKNKVANGYIGIAKDTYQRNVVIEEFTTENCGNCPRVAGYLHTALKKADLTRVFAVCHHSAYYTDWLTQQCDEDIYPLLFGNRGSFAPAMTYNRNADLISNSDQAKTGVVGIPSSASVITATINQALKEVANAKLDMEVTYNDDKTQATVTVTGVCNEAYDTDNALLTFYVTEDNIKARRQSGASGTYYQQHVIRYYNSSWGETVDWNNYTFTKSFVVDINSNWKKEDIKFVAFLNKHNTKNYADNKIENSIGLSFDSSTGINGVYNNGDATVVTCYNVDGTQISAPQKGLNIVKLSDGRTLKVMVK